jgi:hypothetical protein
MKTNFHLILFKNLYTHACTETYVLLKTFLKIYRQGLRVCDALTVDDFILGLTQFQIFGVFL